MRDPYTVGADVALSFLVSKAVSFVFDCILFSSVTLIPKGDEQKCLDPSLGIGNWCTVLLLTKFNIIFGVVFNIYM